MNNLLFKSLMILLLISNFRPSTSAVIPQDKKPVRYLNPVFEKVTIQKDVVFGEATNIEGKSEKLLLDIYTPEGDTKDQRAVMLLFHGGGFRPGNDKTQSYIVRLSNDFAQRGYVCVSFNYRVRSNPKDDQKGTMKDALQDAMTGLNWVRANQKILKIDLNKIIVGGGSAGGMLAVNFCYKDNTVAEKWDKTGIIALIDLWGSPDPSYMFSTIDKNDPPTIMVHGTVDKLVSYQNSVKLDSTLKANNIKHELITIEGGEHTPVNHYAEFSEKIAAFIFPFLSK